MLTLALPAQELLGLLILTVYKPGELIFMVAVACPDVIPGPDHNIVLVAVLGRTDNTALPDIQVGAVMVGLSTEV